jgi:hypothetical protein
MRPAYVVWTLHYQRQQNKVNTKEGKGGLVHATVDADTTVIDLTQIHDLSPEN